MTKAITSTVAPRIVGALVAAALVLGFSLMNQHVHDHTAHIGKHACHSHGGVLHCHPIE